MILRRLESFVKDYNNLPSDIQKRVDKQLRFLVKNPKHPSLNTKKMKDPSDIWEARVTESYRLTFQIEKDTYILRRVGTHDILRSP